MKLVLGNTKNWRKGATLRLHNDPNYYVVTKVWRKNTLYKKILRIFGIKIPIHTIKVKPLNK